ncbi:DUF433 domain-containing protein [Xanthobacter dioxanivorans]|uniref:DUF433 domain-containing protein n=1 Tax=Xanthobacter dioxanivorans TaxID=2528964 RepID=A0A974SII3_9HYPH|nr:DUF433 domain-containing protein [Xanthobacter dioxanivorans]QRG06730.1 DUF433 domain-containing protein [Xanthobacter dioxanivorans]
MASAQTLTLSEAGYVLGRSPSTLNKAVDSGVIRAKQRRVGKSVQRLLGPSELRYLRLADELDKDLTPAGRRRLYEALRKLSSETHILRLGQIEIDLARIDSDLEGRLTRLRRLRDWIGQSDAVSDPLIRGTDIPVHLVAALAREQTVGEILADFPSLNRDQVEAAVDYAKAYPKRGRPYASHSLKRTLADLADLGAFDEGDEAHLVSPRTVP